MNQNQFRSRDWQSHPPYSVPKYKSTSFRSPQNPLIPLKQTISELSGPIYNQNNVNPLDHDLTKNAAKKGHEAMGERIVVTGQVMDERGRAQPETLIEIWQCNAAGRYIHVQDQHNAPIDPNFFGGGRCITKGDGTFKFYTIKPAAYPWGNHANAWRPAHIHFSLFGPTFITRLVTQSYFPGDPLLKLDPIFNSVPENCRNMLVKKFSLDDTEEGFAVAYRFNFILRGPNSTPLKG